MEFYSLYYDRAARNGVLTSNDSSREYSQNPGEQGYLVAYARIGAPPFIVQCFYEESDVSVESKSGVTICSLVVMKAKPIRGT